METTVGESLARRLVAWGVDTVFGLPGDGINGLMEGFRRVKDDLEFVLVHHEEAAAFMATGYAKATGRLGVCCATSGPGAIHLLNGLYDAKLDHAPVLRSPACRRPRCSARAISRRCTSIGCSPTSLPTT